MFEGAELGRSIPKQDYEARLPALRTGLLEAQNALARDRPFSVVVVIGGVDGAGKGDTVNVLHEWMDPRYLETHAFGAPSEEELERPPMWRFWRELPPKGRIGIFFGSWYTQPIVRRVYGRCSGAEFERELAHVRDFERMLADDGTLVLKYWFHLSKRAQKRRLKKLSQDPERSFRVGPLDWKHFKMYDEFVVASERALAETSTEFAPWEVIEGVDARYRQLTTGEHLLAQLRGRLADEPRRRARHLEEARPPEPVQRRGQPTIVGSLAQPPPIEEADYEERLVKWQGKLNRLSRKAQEAGATLLSVFEGPDAAGKGGAIRRMTRALDARYYHVVPIAAPSAEEKARHFLWRFWLKLPRRGRLVIFDRSWYGRVLVERVEGFATPREWQRGYAEIREFEELLVESGIGLVKCWLHIDPDEQARRFQERENTSYKEFKITPEDYRNREKWPLYEDAVQEMIERTSTRSAPWTVVAANDKRHARLTVLEKVCESLKDCIARRREAG